MMRRTNPLPLAVFWVLALVFTASAHAQEVAWRLQSWPGPVYGGPWASSPGELCQAYWHNGTSKLYSCSAQPYQPGSTCGCAASDQPFASSVGLEAYGSFVIALTGPSSTKALPAGPALPQTAKLTPGIPGKAVGISTASGGSLTGVTDAAGEFRFTYVPSRRHALTDTLTATCTGCSNIARKQIVVEACDICSKP